MVGGMLLLLLEGSVLLVLVLSSFAASSPLFVRVMVLPESVEKNVASCNCWVVADAAEDEDDGATRR